MTRQRLRVTNSGSGLLQIAGTDILPGRFADFDADQVPEPFRSGATVLPSLPPAETGARIISILQSQLAGIGETRDNEEVFYRVTDVPGEPIYRVVGGQLRALVTSTSFNTLWVGTQAEYDAISVKDANTEYNILKDD